MRLPRGNEADGDIRDYFEPDLIVVCDPRKIDAAGIRGAPDFVVEVQSPSTAAYDLIDKRLVYERAGVREYWSIDALGGVLIRFVHDGLKFGPPEYLHARGVVRLQALPELAMDLDFLAEFKVKDEPSPRGQA